MRLSVKKTVSLNPVQSKNFRFFLILLNAFLFIGVIIVLNARLKGGLYLNLILFFPKFFTFFLSLFIASLGVSAVASLKMIDISIGSVAVLIATIFVSLGNYGSLVFAFIVAFFIAVFCGLFNGILVSIFKKEKAGLIVTLVMFFLAREVAVAVAGGDVLYFDLIRSGFFSLYRIGLPLLVASVFLFLYYIFFIKRDWLQYFTSYSNNPLSFTRLGIPSIKLIMGAYLLSSFSALFVALITISTDGIIDPMNTAALLHFDVLFISILSIGVNPSRHSFLFEICLFSLFFSLVHFLFSFLGIYSSFLWLFKVALIILLIAYFKIDVWFKERA